jgi:hypothetical protein
MSFEADLITDGSSVYHGGSSEPSDAVVVVSDTEIAGSTTNGDNCKANLLEEINEKNATDTVELSNSTMEKSKRRVSFDRIQIRNYDTVLGDNPCTFNGPPISLDWEYNEQEPVLVHDYETCREGSRRKIHQMRMPSFYRRRILEQAGTTPDEIKLREKEMRQIRKNRERTTALLPFSKFQELLERMYRRNSRRMSICKA